MIKITPEKESLELSVVVEDAMSSLRYKYNINLVHNGPECRISGTIDHLGGSTVISYDDEDYDDLAFQVESESFVGFAGYLASKYPDTHITGRLVCGFTTLYHTRPREYTLRD
jgi:hypothetical protein